MAIRAGTGATGRAWRVFPVSATATGWAGWIIVAVDGIDWRGETKRQHAAENKCFPWVLHTQSFLHVTHSETGLKKSTTSSSLRVLFIGGKASSTLRP